MNAERQLPKISLKLWMAHGTKKVRDAPKDMEALSAIVKANVKDQKDYCLWYQDEADDWITIADDDDLQLAYECAQIHSAGSLKLYVKPMQVSQSDSKAKTDSMKAETAKT